MRSAEVCEDVAEIVAGDVRFFAPRAVLDWTPGQRFTCKVGDLDQATCVFHGVVVARDASSVLISNGGLGMQLPLKLLHQAKQTSAPNEPLTISLRPLTTQRKRRA